MYSWHDNTSGNNANPDSDNWIGFGQRSTDDMSFAWISYYSLSEEEFKQMVMERREIQKKKANELSARAQ